jgi:hypothetical protein
MTCPRCKCEECRRVELQAVLARRIESRETIPVDQINARAIEAMREREGWCDTYEAVG